MFANGTTVAGDPNGNSGTANNQLQKPIALAWLSRTGALFIADQENNRIMRVFTSNISLVCNANRWYRY